MKKLSFFSIPRNKTRKETIEVIKKCSLIANGWKFVEKSEIKRIGLEVVHEKQSFATQFCDTVF